ncbi:MAG: efflux RND transporter periplasmic adaptor subunit [Spirochaetaceae bacterium]|nr:efflux RND transporter periplasmic adaptor subunit [Spirochaetaceae bacterium]
MMKKSVGILCAVCTLLFISCNRNNEKSTVSEKEISLTPVSTLKVERADYYEYGEYYGRVQGVKRASIISMTGGTVESVNVAEGSLVSEGESLSLISSEKAQLTLDSAILNEKISHDNYNALKRFLQSGTSSQINVDQAHLQWLNSKAQLLDAEKAYNGAFCIAPISGVVVSRNIDTDDEISPGHESFLIEDLSQIEIKIGIPEADMEGIQEGSPAQITLDLFPGRIWEGELVRFSRKSSDRNLTFSATILVNNEDSKILSGTTAKVKLLRNRYDDHIVLPADSIIREDSGDYVMILEGETVIKRYVELGPSDVTECVVFSGLNGGEIIVHEGLHLIVDSQQVAVINKEA